MGTQKLVEWRKIMTHQLVKHNLKESYTNYD